MTRSLSLRRFLTGAFVFAGSAALCATVRPAQAQTAYALANNGTSLISFNIANPTATVTTVGNINGSVTSLEGIDFRPSNGLLYGYSFTNNRIVTINLANATTSFVSTPTVTSSNATLGLDFNPVADRLRLVNVDDQNLRINAETGAVIPDGTLAYAAGDVNAASNPNLVEAAYTNNDNDPNTGTQLYYIDSITNTLVTTSDPNGGVLNTVGNTAQNLGVNPDTFTGFDIFTSAAGVNNAYALFRIGGTAGTTGLYSINLQTGAATLQGNIAGTQITSLAIAPTAAAPEPESLALLGTGVLSALGVVVRRRRRAA